MLDTLITSKTRIKLLMKFFLNPGTRAYLRELALEFDESTNAVFMSCILKYVSLEVLSTLRSKVLLSKFNKSICLFNL